MTTSSAAKDFGPIRDDYAFFETHATEAAEDLAAYLPGFRDALARRLAAIDARGTESATSERCRVLDFGCGPGGFSTKFLDGLGCLPDRLTLTLVDPQPSYLDGATESIARYSTLPLRRSAVLPPDAAGTFDLILANHVLYYVPDLDETLPALVRSLAPGGLFQTAIAGRENPLIQFWIAAFAMLGRPVPYHMAENVADAFNRHGIRAATRSVPYSLVFPDSPENRTRILRFLLGEHFAELPESTLLCLFDPYATADTITIKTSSRHFIVTA
jgi:trans-aconitate 2-methyltransferase